VQIGMAHTANFNLDQDFIRPNFGTNHGMSPIARSPKM
jgi:hypothetical protein